MLPGQKKVEKNYKKLLTSWNQNDNISFVGALRSGQQPRAAIHNRSLITE